MVENKSRVIIEGEIRLNKQGIYWMFHTNARLRTIANAYTYQRQVMKMTLLTGSESLRQQRKTS